MADPTDPKATPPSIEAGPDTKSETKSDTKSCPLCGETIKAVAIRCKHCQADLSSPDFDRGVNRPARGNRPTPTPTPPPKIESPAPLFNADGSISDVEFERRFLDFAYETHERINAISVAHALKIPISQADDRLEMLAASDVLHRDVDDEGSVFYSLPGLRKNALATLGRPGSLLHASHLGLQSLQPNGMGAPIDQSLVIGPPPPTEAAAVTGLVLNLCMPGVGSIVAGKPGPGIAQLAMLVAGVPLCFVLIGFPLVFAAWLWSIMTAASALQEARRAPA